MAAGGCPYKGSSTNVGPESREFDRECLLWVRTSLSVQVSRTLLVAPHNHPHRDERPRNLHRNGPKRKKSPGQRTTWSEWKEEGGNNADDRRTPVSNGPAGLHLRAMLVLVDNGAKAGLTRKPAAQVFGKMKVVSCSEDPLERHFAVL